jgi:hypothetical protein
MGRDGADARRVTTTLSADRKGELERLAKREGVKEAWIVRRALERYLDQIAGGSILAAEKKRNNNARG